MDPSEDNNDSLPRRATRVLQRVLLGQAAPELLYNLLVSKGYDPLVEGNVRIELGTDDARDELAKAKRALPPTWDTLMIHARLKIRRPSIRVLAGTLGEPESVIIAARHAKYAKRAWIYRIAELDDLPIARKRVKKKKQPKSPRPVSTPPAAPASADPLTPGVKSHPVGGRVHPDSGVQFDVGERP